MQHWYLSNTLQTAWTVETAAVWAAEGRVSISNQNAEGRHRSVTASETTHKAQARPASVIQLFKASTGENKRVPEELLGLLVAG